MRTASLKKIIYLYLTVPVVVFMAGWLKWYFALAGAGAAIVSLLCVCCRGKDILGQEEYGDKYPDRIDKRTLLLALAIAMIWCFLAGQGGFFYQSGDHNARNAILRDLIMKEWPVVYPEQNMGLVYYIGHWLVPALFGKVWMAAGNADLAWKAANIALYVWSSVGIMFVCLLVFRAVRADTVKKQAFAAAFLVFFSGLDVVGILFQSVTNHRLIVIDHIESWSTIAEYSSLTTCLFWVFNQTIVPWIMILLYLCKESIHNYAFLGICCVLYGPLPALGLLPFMIGRAVKEFICCKSRKIRVLTIRKIFSIPNILSVVFIFPILFLYLKGNYAWNISGIGYVNRSPWGIVKTLLVMALFVLLEYGIYALLLWKYWRIDFNYWICVISLTAILFFQVGMGGDFTMRVSIPAIMILMIFTLRTYLKMTEEAKVGVVRGEKEEAGKRQKRAALFLMTAILLIGAVTPAVEYFRAGSAVIKEKKLAAVADEMRTLEGQETKLCVNFVTFNVEEDTFFKYIAR